MYIIAIYDTMYAMEDQMHYHADDDGLIYVYTKLGDARMALTEAIEDMLPPGATIIFKHINRRDTLSVGYEYVGHRYNCGAAIEQCHLVS